jgi:SAM-dependent methyltransferase
MMSPMLARIQAAIHAPDRWTRLTHYLFAAILFRLPVPIRRRLYAGEEYYCPLCEAHLRKFLALHRPYHLWCPVCRSLQRPRLGWLFLNTPFIEISRRALAMLHVAPEPALAARLRRLPDLNYLSADLFDPKAMVKMDITDIRYPEHSFDLIYCSHVLEHVSDDRKALSEFWRVLKPDGKAIILVPILGDKTFEDPSITDPVERERFYGQHDHVRSYGIDITDRLKAAGFQVTIVQPQDLADDNEIRRMGLPPNEIIFLCQKPNIAAK